MALTWHPAGNSRSSEGKEKWQDVSNDEDCTDGVEECVVDSRQLDDGEGGERVDLGGAAAEWGSHEARGDEYWAGGGHGDSFWKYKRHFCDVFF